MYTHRARARARMHAHIRSLFIKKLKFNLQKLLNFIYDLKINALMFVKTLESKLQINKKIR